MSKVFKKIVAGKLGHYLESNNLLPPSQFSYIKGLGPSDALLTFSHQLRVALDRGIGGRLVQLHFSAAFDVVSHCGLLQFLFIVSEFLSDRRQRVRLDGKVSESVNVVP